MNPYLIDVRDASTGDVLHHEPVEPAPFVCDDASWSAVLDVIRQQAETVTRLRRLLLEVASLGLVTDEARVGPAAPGHCWLECPRVLWDQIEAEVGR